MAQKQQQDSKKGKPSSAGKRKEKIQGYFTSARLAEHKIRRILRCGGSNAINEAQSWADKNEATLIFRRVMTPEMEGRLAVRVAKSAIRAEAARARRYH